MSVHAHVGGARGGSPTPASRRCASLQHWRDRIDDSLALLKQQVNDAHPRVRLEAVRACSFYQTPKAAEIALEATNHETDKPGVHDGRDA